MVQLPPGDILLERERLARLATAVSHILSIPQALDQILQECARTIVSHLDVAFARIWLLDQAGDTLILRASEGQYTNLHGAYSRVNVISSLKIGQMVVDRQPRLTNRLQEENWVREPDWARREGFVAYAGCPLIAQDHVVGVMAMFARQTLSDRTLDELAAISGGIAQCIVRCEAEDALRVSQERLLLAVETAEIGLCDWNIPSGHMIWSDRFYSLLGYDVLAVVPSLEAWKTRVHTVDLAKLTTALETHGAEQESVRVDHRIVRPDTGDIIWVSARGRYSFKDNHTPARLVIALSDISHRKEAEAKIARLLEEARRHECELLEKQAQLVQAAKLASLGELATGVAHELNNPLNNIGLFVGNALDKIDSDLQGPMKNQLTVDLRGATEQIQRAATIIDQLRMFGRTPKETYEPVSLGEVVTRTLTFLKEPIRLGGVTVSTIAPTPAPLVHGCQIQLEQVCVNLVRNAIDAMKHTPVKTLTVTYEVVGNQANIVFQDTGSGIAPDVLPRVFDPFFTTKEVGTGTGVGLSIAYGIVREHHGDLSVESEAGQGSRFVVSLPLNS
jgi:signal transduction histidine kinase